MFWAIVRFELRYHLQNPLFHITIGLLFLLAFGAVSSDSIQVGGAIGHVDRNAPLVITNLLVSFSVLGLFIVTAFVASSIHRDFERGTHELFFTRPVGPRRLLLGRFTGSMLVSAALFVGPIAGILVGAAMPWLDPARVGATTLLPYVFAMGVMVLPNLLVMGAVFFTLAGLTRSMLATYLGVVVSFVAYGISQFLLRDLPSQLWGAILDPFGMAAVRVATRYWTIAERNQALPELAGVLLANRLLWLAVGLSILAFCVLWFDPARALASSRRGRPQDEPRALPSVRSPATVRPPERRFDLPAQLQMLGHQLRLETVLVLKSAPFVVMLLIGVLNVITAADFSDLIHGTKVLPVTHLMLDTLDGSYLFMLMIIVVFYAGEAIWRDRSHGTAEVHDALPTPTWVFIAGKMGALGVVVVVFTVMGALSTMGYQLAVGYTDLEPGLYASGLLLALIPFALGAVMAVTVQVLARSKFLGFLVMLLYFTADDVYQALHMEHFLYRFPFLPSLPYSDLNGWGHFLAPYLWFSLYWGFFSVLLAVAAVVFWQRGAESAWRHRLHLARQRLTPAVTVATVLATVGFLATGAFIFYNTNVVNEYLPGDEAELRRAEYEIAYRQYRDLPLPKITEVAAEVDIFPAERRVAIHGRYLLENRGGEALDQLHLSLPSEVELVALQLPSHRQDVLDERLGYRILTLDEGLAPGASMIMGFELTVANPGFVNNGSNVRVVGNGTFFSNREVFPIIGYNEAVELQDRNARRRHGLAPDRRMARRHDPLRINENDLGPEADWIRFSTTVSTAADQVALAPGYLEAEWQEGGRRYFRYRMDAPILHFFSYLSARYELRRERWRDVTIEVYFDPRHDANVDRMIAAAKQTLEYCTANFGPYQHRQLRILEFPRYRSFAQSFDNTIPFSEGIGFIARLADPDAIDTVFYVTAHEVAHQWWGHQVVSANVEGANMIGEALTQYTALMVMESELGAEKMRRFLKYELDRYLAQRGGDPIGEKPLLTVERQPYIYYRKGSVAMYALKDYVGEATVNRALKRFVDATRFQGPPYPTTAGLRALLAEEAPAGSEGLLGDLFDTITLYSNRATAAVAVPISGERYRVTLEVEAAKLRADALGAETPMALDDWVDIGVYGAGGELLYLAKHHLHDATSAIEVEVQGRPVRAGIDPLNKLVDRDSEDNLTAVKIG